MDIVTMSQDGLTYLSISHDHSLTLQRFKPKDCPFKGYSLFDLVKDSVWMYAYKLVKHGETMPLFDYVKELMDRGYVLFNCYGQGQFILDVLYEGD